MAEAAGLVFGGVALVGLISTCVEISEYLESAKNRARDLKIALTKVNLIKQRLDDWGAARPADIPPDPRSNHTTDLMTCGVLLLIEETLKRMKVLLDETNSMSRRHSLRSPFHQRHLQLNSCPNSRTTSFKLPCRSNSVTSGTSLPLSSGASSRTSHPRIPQLLLSLPLKVLWVFQDRKRFDSIIEQLDFLLSNLEKISETFQRRREMAQNHGPGQNTSYTDCQTPLDNRIDRDIDSALDMRHDSDRGALTRGFHQLENDTVHPAQNMPVTLSLVQGGGQVGAQLYDNFENNTAEDDGRNFQGNISSMQNIGTLKRNFKDNKAKDRGSNFQGNIGPEIFEKVMEKKVEEKVEGKIQEDGEDDREAGGARLR